MFYHCAIVYANKAFAKPVKNACVFQEIILICFCQVDVLIASSAKLLSIDCTSVLDRCMKQASKIDDNSEQCKQVHLLYHCCQLFQTKSVSCERACDASARKLLDFKYHYAASN